MLARAQRGKGSRTEKRERAPGGRDGAAAAW